MEVRATALLHELEVEIVPGQIADLGDVHFSNPLYHYSLQIDTPGDDYPSHLKVDPIQEDPKAAAVFQEDSYTDFLKTGKAGVHLFSLSPVDQVRVSMGGAGQIFSVSEGVTEIAFAPL